MSLLSNAVIAEAKRYLGVIEVPKNSNRGLCIDYWVREAGLDPAGAFPWCAAFVGQIGRQALGYRWPVPRTASVAAIAAWAAAKGITSTVGAGGDLFVLWNAGLNRFAHIGVVTNYNVTTNEYDTIEGNTNGDGSREGFGVFARHRAVHPRDRFIRWEATV